MYFLLLLLFARYLTFLTRYFSLCTRHCLRVILLFITYHGPLGPGLGPLVGSVGPGPAWGPQSIRQNPHQKITSWSFLGKHMTKNNILGDFGVNICDVLMKSELLATHHTQSCHPPHPSNPQFWRRGWSIFLVCVTQSLFPH